MEMMTRDEVREAIGRSWLGVLSLARGDHAYAFPLFYAYRDGAFYFHSHPGEKDEFIRATEEACLTIVRALSEDDWTSVMAFGHLRAATRTDEIARAMDALLHVPPPPKLGLSVNGEPLRSEDDVTFWMLRPMRMTGRKSVRPISV